MAITRVSGDLIGQNTVTNQNIAASVQDAYGWRNRIINGDMRIDQRNAGASVSITTDAKNYVMDRFWAYDNTDGAFSLQQVIDAPAGFVNSAKVTITTADASVGTDQYAGFSQLIEGTNSYDLAWGTASASTVTLSFWVKSSVTGTFGGSLRNDAANRSYPFSYTITAANTWEYKTITVDGDTSGTWLTTTGIGIRVNWSIADGPNRVGTAGAWAGVNYAGATGQTQLISTLNATWQVTGVQLEAGSVATAFERRDFGRELVMCQRYFETVTIKGSNLMGQYSPNGGIGDGPSFSVPLMVFKVTKRAEPTMPVVTSTSGAWSINSLGNYSATSAINFSPRGVTADGFSAWAPRVSGGSSPNAGSVYLFGNTVLFTASSEL